MSYEPKTYRKNGGDDFVVASGGSIDIESGGVLKLGGVDKTTALKNLLGIAPLTIDGSAGKKACQVNGLTLVTGGSGIADLTLAAPTPGAVAIIRIASLTPGTVVVTAADGVTLDGTNNTATFNAADEALVLVYASATAWAVALNINGVALSDV